MKHAFKFAVIISSIIILGACKTTRKEFIMDAEVVSMTKKDVPSGMALKSKGSVNEKWCAGDKPAHNEHGVDELAYMDQVIYKAQKARNADYITDARFYWIGSDCMSITGQAAVVGGGGNVASDGNPARKKRSRRSH
jgi:hypothetical protein